jgi:flagellar hook-length control protein FliK
VSGTEAEYRDDMQTDSITGRATSPVAPMATQTLSPTQRQGSEKFDDFVENARNEDLADKNNRPEQALNAAADVKSPPDSKGDADEQGKSSRSSEDHPGPMTKKSLLQSEPGRTGNGSDPAGSVQEGDAETEKPLVRADLTQSEIVQAGQQKPERQSEIEAAALAEQVVGNRTENPAIPAGVIAAQGSDSQGALSAGKPQKAARGSEITLPLATAQTDRQNPAILAGLTPSPTAGGSSLLSETGVLSRQGSGNADTLSRYQQPGGSPPPALPAANSPKTAPDNQVSINGQLWATAELAKSEQAATARTQAEMLAAPSASQPQPAAALNAALLTNGVVRATDSGIANPAGLVATPDPGSILTDSDLSERNFAALVESSLPGGSGRSVEYFTGSPQAARLVASQLADALITQQGNRVEISLTPAELGRVRMALSTTDAGVLVSISAERPETLDLMRRHIDQLADEFRKLGYAGIDFEFSGGDGDGGFDKEPTVPRPDDETGPDNRRGIPASGPEPAIRAYVSRGLDLRL